MGQKRTCSNCAFCNRFKYTDTDTRELMRCWQEPGVCDHPFIQTMLQAEKYVCNNHRFQEERDKEMFEQAKLDIIYHKKVIKQIEEKYPSLKDFDYEKESDCGDCNY